MKPKFTLKTLRRTLAALDRMTIKGKYFVIKPGKHVSAKQIRDINRYLAERDS